MKKNIGVAIIAVLSSIFGSVITTSLIFLVLVHSGSVTVTTSQQREETVQETVEEAVAEPEEDSGEETFAEEESEEETAVEEVDKEDVALYKKEPVYSWAVKKLIVLQQWKIVLYQMYFIFMNQDIWNMR